MKPTTTLLIGDSLFGHEARFLRRLCADLEPVGALILANFQVDHRQIDFVVVTESYAAILEQKQFTQPVFGRQNGQWYLEDGAGKRVPYSGQNPWQQALQQKYSLSDEMKRYEKQTGRVGGNRSFFTEFDAFVCIAPAIHCRSDVTPGDSKVAVRSYAEVIDILRSAAKPASWSRADWTRFAIEHLALTPVTLQEATDPRVRASVQAVRGYLSRIEYVIGFQLPPLLSTTPESGSGQPLIDSILDGSHHLLVGPSGSAKTFHLHHIAIAAARKGDEVPILVEAKTFRGGEFWPLVRRGIAPLFPGDPKELLDAIRFSGLRPVLLVDALNECPTEHYAELLRGVQAFALHFDARVVFTSQDQVELPSDLKAEMRQLTTPSGEERRCIYCYHAGIDISPAADYFCEGFSNAYELTVAGRCHGSGAPAASRAELYDRYVRTTLPEHYHVAIGLLRAVATEMAATISSSWNRAQYELFAERFLSEQGASVAVLDEVRRCRLIRVTEEFFSFEHELLADYFSAAAVLHRLKDSADFVTTLQKPRNQRLIELILPRLSDDEEVGNVLSIAMDQKVLDSALSGRCGDRARSVLKSQVEALFKLAVEDLATLKCKCYIAQLDDGRKRLGGVSVESDRVWTSYCQRLCEFVAHHMDEPSIAAGFLELLDLTEYSLRRAVERAAAENWLKPHRVWEEAVRLNGGILRSSTMQLPCTEILANLRSALMLSQCHYPNGLPISEPLFERATATVGSHFALLALFQDRNGVQLRDFETNLALVRRGWDSEIYILRVDALEFLQWMRRHVPQESVTRVCDMLSEFATDNIMENTVRLDTLTAYGGMEPPVAVEEALREMRATIAPDGLTDPAVVEAAQALGVTPAAFLASRATGCLNNIFEDIFQGVYWEAYAELSRAEKCAVLSRATECEQVSFHADWLLRELIEHGGHDTLDVYERFASGIDGGTWSPQDATAAFLLALEGCARWKDNPPRYTGGDSPAHRAWAAIGEIWFWTYRKNDVARTLWSRFEGPTRLAAADVLYNIAHCTWKLNADGPPAVNLLVAYPHEIRPIIEDCIRERESLPTAFNYGGSRDRGVVSYLIDVLGKTGNASSIPVLHALVDDPDLGREAIHAIESIRRTIAQPPL